MKLLVVEDEAPLRRTLERALREEGFLVESAADGPTGLAFALHTPFDLVLLDVMLPGLDGFEILRRLREGGRAPTPVLMLTARDGFADRVRGLDTGADDYLVKPFDLAELLSRIRALLRRAAQQPSPTLKLPEGVALDTVARSVSKDGAPVELTAMEYSLLEWLSLHRGRVADRDTLYAHLFNDEEDTSSNLIEVHVCNLRRKLGRGVIETRRGLGYVMPQT
jgi:two-component system, OmpR family, response regulator